MSRKGVSCGKHRILSDKQITDIHKFTLNVLNKVGIRVLNNEALEIYRNNGCSVDFGKKIVRIRENILMDYLAKAPSSFTLYGKREDYDLNIDCDTAYLMGGAAAIRIFDLNGQYREPYSSDLNNFTRLQDALENTDIICPMVIPKDIDADILEPYISAETMKNTNKNCDLWVHSSLEVGCLIKIAEIITGKKFSEKPIFTLCIDLISPLVQPDDVLEVLIESVKRDIPVYIEVCSMMGTTAPVTIAGTLVQQSVNILSGIALAQMIKPGAHCFYSIASAVTNMNTGGYLAGDPATVLLHAATAQISHYYNLPFNCGSGLDSKLPDIQAGYERAFQNMGCIAAGGNVVHLGTGMLEQMAMANYESAIIDDEIFGICTKYFNGVEIDEERMAEKTITEAFLNDKREYITDNHTLMFFKENLWNKSITNQDSFEIWDKKGRIDAVHQAKEIASNLIKNHHPNIVDEEQEKLIGEVLKETKIKLKEKR